MFQNIEDTDISQLKPLDENKLTTVGDFIVKCRDTDCGDCKLRNICPQEVYRNIKNINERIRIRKILIEEFNKLLQEYQDR